MTVDLSKIDAYATEIYIVVNIHQAETKVSDKLKTHLFEFLKLIRKNKYLNLN